MTILYCISQNWIRKRFNYGQHYQDNKKQCVLFVAVPSANMLAPCWLSSWYARRWKRFMFAYNIAMSAFSLGVFIVCAEALLRLPIRTGDCDLWYREAPAFVWAVYLFYLSKFVEYLVRA